MQNIASKEVNPSLQTLPGFIVSGHRGDVPTDGNAALVAVLAATQEAAFVVAIAGDVLFRPAGCITESDLAEQIGFLADLHRKNPETKDFGFVVGGFVGEIPTNEGSGMIAILAANADEAIVQSVIIQNDFHPTGCISEADLKKYAGAIERLRSNPTR